MASTASGWDEYTAWNQAIADVVYGASAAGHPTYLDLEDETITHIRDAADPTAKDPSGALVAAVRNTLRFRWGPAAVFQLHLRKLENWNRGTQLEPPPCLALLAVLSLAAENMRETDGIAANNYYGRLAELLELDDGRKEEFIAAYRRSSGTDVPTSEFLWKGLTDWLERLEGNRGLPTAFAAGHTHIGLPLSQALVRHTDRDRLHQAFALYGLPPQSSLAASEMEALIEEWLGRTPCPASNSFERLWKHHQSARDRIIEVARFELESWDGVEEAYVSGSERISDTLRLSAVRKGFPSPRVEIGLAAPALTSQTVDSLEFLGLDGLALGEVDLVATSGGWLTLADSTTIDVTSILQGEVCLRRRESGLTIRRRPRRLVPLRFDNLLQGFVEAERIGLGEEHLLLARDDVQAQLLQIINDVARPGFRCHSRLAGLPDGWTLFEGVQVVSSIPEDLLKNRLLDLNVLQPLARTQVVLDGGLKIPGNIAKWSTRRPPELRVTADADVQIRATLRASRALADPAPSDRSRESDQPVLIWPLSDEHLPDGDYEIEVTGNGELLGRKLTLRLRTADNPAVLLPHRGPPLRHDIAGQLYGLAAAPTPDGAGFSVAPTTSETGSETGETPHATPHWRSARSSRTETYTGARLFAPTPAEDSCMVTGAHYMIVEAATSGMASVGGVCRTCGLIKRYPTRGRRKRSHAQGRTKSAPRVVVSDLEPVSEQARLSWELGFDTLCHIGEGPMSALTRVASQIEAGELFGDAFARRLEALGHIEIERNPQNLQASSWSVTDPTIVGLPSGDSVLVGFRSERLLSRLDDFAYEHGFELDTDPGIDAPTLIRLPPLDAELLEQLIAEIGDATGRPSQHVPQACDRLATALPPLSDLIGRLPTTSAIGGRSYERWDLARANFESTTDAGAPGAYRIKSFGLSYIYRRPEHVGAMTAVVGNARLVKYAAALDAHQSLLGYDSEQELLYVPLGADLPGMYGRAAVLASGRPPHQNVQERVLEYRDVPAELAGRLNRLLMS